MKKDNLPKQVYTLTGHTPEPVEIVATTKSQALNLILYGNIKGLPKYSFHERYMIANTTLVWSRKA